MTNVAITENTTTVQVTENIVTVTAAPGVSSDTLTADIATHNALATAHGLTANISAALSGAASPSAGNVFATVDGAGFVAATTSTSGKTRYATEAEAEAGTATTAALTPASIYDVLFEAGFGADWYVDSVNGNDNFSGTSRNSAFATLTKLQTQTISAGAKIALARGSHWREQLTITAASVTVRAYGEGARPILDCSNVISAASWSKTGGLTNVYEVAVTIASSVITWVGAWEDDIHLIRATSAANCDAVPGSYFPSADTSSPITLYIHASDSGNPASNGKAYDYSARQYGLEMYDAASPIITGIETRRNLHNDGSMRVGRSGVVTNCVVRDGTKHSILYRDGSTLNSVQAIDAYYTSGYTPFVYNENTPAGLGVTHNNCTVTNANAALTNAGLGTGFYGHKNTSGSFGTAVYNNCISEDLYYGWDGQDAAITLNTCTVNDASVSVQVQCIGSTFTLNTCTLNATINNILTQAAGGQTIAITGGTLNAPGSNSNAINITQPNVTLNLSGVDINTQYTCVGNSAPATGFVFTMNTCDLDNDFNWAGIIATLAATTTYTGDNNTYRTSQVTTHNGTVYNTLADLTAATGQDAASTFVP